MFPEAFAHQVQSKWVHTGVGEGQDASAHAGDEVAQRRVHLVVVVGAVQVDHMTREPAERKQADKHKHSFSQTLPGPDLTGEEREERVSSASNGWMGGALGLKSKDSLQRPAGDDSSGLKEKFACIEVCEDIT